MRKLNRKQERELICGFLASSRVLIFAVIGHNTINIPEIFQLFMTFLSATQPFLVSSRNAPGEECCLTTLKTDV